VINKTTRALGTVTFHHDNFIGTKGSKKRKGVGDVISNPLVFVVGQGGVPSMRELVLNLSKEGSLTADTRIFSVKSPLLLSRFNRFGDLVSHLKKD
jgi:hypothetical protein